MPEIVHKPCLIYLFVTEGRHYAKIGVTDKPIEYRHRQVQSCCPLKIIIEAYFFGKSKDEGRLHRRFKAYRLHSEWFRYAPEMSRIFAEPALLDCVKIEAKPEKILPVSSDILSVWGLIRRESN
jgi:hypothetical protein